MHKKALVLALLGGAAVAVGAAVAPQAEPLPATPLRTQPAPAYSAPVAAAPAAGLQPGYLQPGYGVSPTVQGALIRWNSLRQSDAQPFSAYASFLTQNPGWPGEASLRRTAEGKIDPNGGTSSGEVLNFFRVHPPLTNAGRARYAFALLAAGRTGEAREAARSAWTAGTLPVADETRLQSLFGAQLTPADHDGRIAMLLDGGQVSAAQRVLPWASPSRAAVYRARMAIQTRSPDADAQLSALGPVATTDAGILLDRAKALRASGSSVAARALLARSRTLTHRPADVEEWYETLLTLARGAAADRNWSTAYQIASQIDDALPAGADVSAQSLGVRDDYTSLAWLAGTTALQKLNRPVDAMSLFVRYAQGGKSAQVLTKGMYWAGRSAQAAGQPGLASGHFAAASRYPELFYGQLALERIGQPVPAPTLVPLHAPSPAERAAFARRPIVEAVRALGLQGRWSDQSTFVRALAESAQTETDKVLVAELSRTVGRPDLGVWLARSARNDGSPFYVRAGWPDTSIPPAQSHLWSLAHGIMRQESSFDRAAVSHAGARGMMQLMPGTARETSGKMGLPYDFGRLTSDPSYNIMLGSRYFETLLSRWGGNAPLAVASYNAGAGNVNKWVREYGDPRMPGVDVIEWIENIPFSETRGYVQRVLENAVVYDTIAPGRARSPAGTRLSYYLGKQGRPG